MIQFKFSNTDSSFEDAVINVPTSWSDVTVGAMQEILAYQATGEASNPLWRLSVYTGVPFSVWNNAEINETEFEVLLKALEFEKEALSVEEIQMPNAIGFYKRNASGLVEEKPFVSIRVPKKLDEKQVGKKVMFNQVVSKHAAEYGSIVHVVEKAIAIYFQTEIMPAADKTKPFDTDKVEEMYEMCKDCKFVEAFPVATFFLTKYLNLSR